jgi:hypothetical protein
MKLKFVVVDVEVPSRVKKWGLGLGIPLAVMLGGGAVAYAAGLMTWTSGQTLTAADLNNNFSLLQSEITALQGQVHPPSGFRAWTSNAIPIANPTIVIFDQVDYDMNSEYRPRRVGSAQSRPERIS